MPPRKIRLLLVDDQGEDPLVVRKGLRGLLALIVRERSNKEIATKLGVQDRTRAATTATQRGIISL